MWSLEAQRVFQNLLLFCFAIYQSTYKWLVPFQDKVQGYIEIQEKQNSLFSRFFKICFCFVLLYNKSLNDCSLGEQ